MHEFTYNDNNLAIAYYRYSSSSQNEASIEQQREQAHAYADLHGYTIIKEYKDEAKSGTTSDRPGYKQMLYEIEQLKPAVLILWKTDRLSRDRYELPAVKKKIRLAGCSIKFVAEPNLEDSGEAEFMESVLEGFAAFYSIQLSCNIKRGLRYNAERCMYNGHKVIGYDVDKNTKKYIVDPSSAPIVRRVFEEYAAGKPLKEIVAGMNADGLRTSRGSLFNHESLRKMLRNRKYIGEYSDSGVVIPDGMPAIVTHELFEQCQTMLDRNKRNGPQQQADEPGRFWLTGRFICGKCGAAMHGTSGNSRHRDGTPGRRYDYYACYDHLHRKGCKMRNVRKETAEDTVRTMLEAMLCWPENASRLASESFLFACKKATDDSEIEMLEEELKSVNKKLSNLVRAIEAGIWSETTQAELKNLETTKHELEGSLNIARAKKELSKINEETYKDYFEKYLGAHLGNRELVEEVMDYFDITAILVDDEIVLYGSYDEDTNQNKLLSARIKAGGGSNFNLGEVRSFRSSLTSPSAPDKGIG